ncbi:hypothetical protein ACQ4LE_010023 [Meloidogyne hapla]|uniref:ShKT domain-containing protein n=1 Tax=Meloidogyne hapla TaxID=6305 RepID=A0A1I8B0E9_MELHA
MMSVCEHTCGLCTSYDECFDLSPDCESMLPLCINRPISPIFRQKCPLSCGLCKRVKSSEEDNDKENNLKAKKSGEVIVLVRKKDQQKCEDKSYYCGDNLELCDDENYSDLFKSQCAKTCGHCEEGESEIEEKPDFVKRIRHAHERQLNRPPIMESEDDKQNFINVKVGRNKNERLSAIFTLINRRILIKETFGAIKNNF